jgi:signal transduction histidine kinase
MSMPHNNEDAEMNPLPTMADVQQDNQQLELFVSLVTHELKTPITSMQGNLQLLKRRLQRLAHGEALDEDSIQQMLTLVERTELQVKRETRLINDLTDISQVQAGKLKIQVEVRDLVQIISAMVKEYRQSYLDHVVHIGPLPQEEASVLIDVERIRQVMNNYLNNAFKYSPRGKPVTVSLVRKERSVCVYVRDEGPGISPQAQRWIWERFQQVSGATIHNGAGKGLGLGLFINQTIVQQHGGQVGVESELGEGATFWFCLPLAETS